MGGQMSGEGAEWRPRRRAGIDLRRESDRAILVDLSGAPRCELNDTAAALWELCDGTTTVEEMVLAIGVLAAEPEATIRADVTRALIDLRGASVLDEVP